MQKKKRDRRHVIVRDWFCARRLNRFLKEEFDKMAARLQWERLPSGTWKDKLIPRQTVGGTHFFSDFFFVFFFCVSRYGTKCGRLSRLHASGLFMQLVAAGGGNCWPGHRETADGNGWKAPRRTHFLTSDWAKSGNEKRQKKIQEMIQVSRHAPPLLKKANCQFCGRGPLKSAAIFDRRQPPGPKGAGAPREMAESH